MKNQTDLVLGTAGHIDHGKSALIQALTGVDPDRLIEEKRRGITIELGFARLELPSGTVLGVVDVPGHERFVRHMIAGATGIDLALLCIAADDGIMPQTEEHIAILELLGIRSCVVALTKLDVVDTEWAELMLEEVREFLSTTSYGTAAIIPVSSRTGEGLSELKEALDEAAAGIVRTKCAPYFRLPIDRVFTLRGAGTIVTGTLWSGSVALEDKVEILPTGLTTRVRSIQIHGESVETASAGHRVALNLGGVSTREVRPGDLVAAPGKLRPTRRFDADFSLITNQLNRISALKNGARVHVAHGAKEVTGRVLLFNGLESMVPGTRALVQIRLDEELVVAGQDHFIVRSYSPMHVIGGGVILLSHPRHRTKLSAKKEQLLEALRSQDEEQAVCIALEDAPLPATVDELATTLGYEQETVERLLCASSSSAQVVFLGGQGGSGVFCTKGTLQQCVSTIEKTLVTFHAERPLEKGMSKEALRRRALPQASTQEFEALLAYLKRQEIIGMADGLVSHLKEGRQAYEAERKASDRLCAMLEEAGYAPPSVSDLVDSSGIEASLAYRALNTLERQGAIRKVEPCYYFSARSLEASRSCVVAVLSRGPAAVAELRDELGVSRKYALVILEHFDQIGLTKREGNVRALGAHWEGVGV